MASLALKAVMWGADKLPDGVFEAIPGGFFTPPHKKNGGQGSRERGMRDSDSAGYGDGGSNDRRHRHRGSRGDEHRSSEHRRRRSRSRRRSYDGGDDTTYDTDSDDRRRRRRSEGHDRKHHNYDDHDRYGYTNGHDRRYSRDSGYGGNPTRPPYPKSNADRRQDRRKSFTPIGATAAAGAVGGAALTRIPQGSVSDSQPPSSESGTNHGTEAKYVPYAHIYGQPNQPPAAQSFAPPPIAAHAGFSQPTGANANRVPVARPPYNQNPYAQDAPFASQPSYIVPAHDYDARDDPHYYDPPAHNERDAVYGSRPASVYSTSRSPSRHRRAYSPSYSSYDSRSESKSRARSTRRSDAPSSRGKSKSRLRQNFDTSERGLGYSAVGALAGGLAGSEIGKGPIPAILGAVIGGAGTSAFQAREKRRESRQYDNSLRRSAYYRPDPRVTKVSGNGYYSD